MERKSIPFVATKIDEEQGIVEHIVAVMGNVDLGKDVIHPGAFTKTISERGLQVRVLDQHQADSVMRALGKPIELREISREELPQKLLAECPEATGALLAKTQFLMDTPEGEGAFKRLKQGAIGEWSFGYDVIQSDFSKKKDGDKAITVRNLRELKLYEYSPVLFGMNPATTTLDAKAKAVSGKTSLGIAPRDREWDAAAADRRVREWAGAEDEPNAKYRQAFFYYDEEAPENFGSYKLGFADVVDGELQAVPRGIFAVAGGRGVDAADIPEDDKEAIKTKVNHYYERMSDEFGDDSLVSPFEKSDNGTAEQKDMFKPLGSSLQGAVYNAAANKLGYWLACGQIDVSELAALTTNINNAVIALTAGLPEDLVMRETEGYGYYGYMSADLEADVKAGRTISKRNEGRLRSALTELMSIFSEAGIVLDEPEPLEDASSHLVDDEEEQHPKPKNAPDKQAATEAGPDVVPPTFNLIEEHELFKLQMEV